jgi:hypothetical protein
MQRCSPADADDVGSDVQYRDTVQTLGNVNPTDDVIQKLITEAPVPISIRLSSAIVGNGCHRKSEPINCLPGSGLLPRHRKVANKIGLFQRKSGGASPIPTIIFSGVSAKILKNHVSDGL